MPSGLDGSFLKVAKNLRPSSCKEVSARGSVRAQTILDVSGARVFKEVAARVAQATVCGQSE
jgi:hypothetical protein